MLYLDVLHYQVLLYQVLQSIVTYQIIQFSSNQVPQIMVQMLILIINSLTQMVELVKFLLVEAVLNFLQAITDVITRLKLLKPYKFNFKADSSTVLDGFFAHEVASVVPEAASGEKDAVATEANVNSGIAENVGDVIPQGLDNARLVPLLTAALQEAIAKIEILERKVAALEG